MARTKYADKLADLEWRVTKLEQDVVWIRAQLAERDKKQSGFLDVLPLTPAQEKLQDEMDAAGRAYRESFRTKAAKPAKKTAVKKTQSAKRRA